MCHMSTLHGILHELVGHVLPIPARSRQWPSRAEQVYLLLQVRRDDGVPVMLPNSSAAEYLVANESRAMRSVVKPSMMFDFDP